MPKGKETFRMLLDREGKKGIGKIHLAETGFVNARWSTAVLKAADKNCLEVTWFVKVWTFQSFVFL